MVNLKAQSTADRQGNVRCAIYTRKSTEEGLDQEFNSLDAQREACTAYIASQRQEGWMMLPGYYDDGGFSGGNMERPGLKQLLADVEAGAVDVIVVYKVDRLTRALSDFAKIVDILDAHDASFVSITQSFNTTTSMGRLTLNVLLSFAQFEREVISERVRDKIAASKKKGMWMGGIVPLGYNAVDRKLVVNEAEAETVRHIMQRYLELGSVADLRHSLEQEGIRTKIRDSANGRIRGGGLFGRGALYHLLQNRTYCGQISYRDEVYLGEHDAIVAVELWNAVQTKLAENRVARSSGTNAREPSLLAGMITDTAGKRLKPSHAVKGSVRYRYYISTTRQSGENGGAALRLAAGDVERTIIEGLQVLLADEGKLADWQAVGSADATGAIVGAARDLASRLCAMSITEQRALLQALNLQVVVQMDRIEACICSGQIATQLGIPISSGKAERWGLPIAPVLRWTGREKRLIVHASSDGPVKRDARLIGLIVKAQAAHKQLFDEDGDRDNEAWEFSDKHTVRLARFAFLAPDIVAAILDGSQPPSLNARRLLRVPQVPLDWVDQRRAFGFA